MDGGRAILFLPPPLLACQDAAWVAERISKDRNDSIKQRCIFIYTRVCVCVCVCVYLFILKLMENRRGFHETTGENPPASRSRWKQFQMIIAARIRGGEGKGWGKSKLEDVERTERSKEEEEGGEGEGGGGGGGGKEGKEGKEWPTGKSRLLCRLRPATDAE